MEDEEKIDILSSDGMLVKRPLLITDDKIVIGFKEKHKVIKSNPFTSEYAKMRIEFLKCNNHSEHWYITENKHM